MTIRVNFREHGSFSERAGRREGFGNPGDAPARRLGAGCNARKPSPVQAPDQTRPSDGRRKAERRFTTWDL